jgi:Tellurite resistance protein TerB
MDLDARLEKLGARALVTNAARAFVQTLRGPVSDGERVLAEEFKAIVEAMFLLAAADGFVTDEEVAQLRSSITKMVSPEPVEAGLDELMAGCLEKLTQDGWNSRVPEVARRLGSVESRSLAFRLAAAVAFVDNEVAPAEAEVIDALAASFGLSADDSQAILRDVVDDLFGTG